MRFSLFSFATVVATSAAVLQLTQATPVKFRRAYPDDSAPDSCRPAALADIVVFGDDYVDNGNTYKLTQQSWPGRPYHHGRFSNGNVWPEYLAESKGYHHANYAYDGATSDDRLVQGYTGPDQDIPVPGFWQQIQLYYDSNQDKIDRKKLEETLFIINFQGYDYHYKQDLDIALVIQHYEQGLRWLIEMGAQHIYVVGGVDVTQTPYYQLAEYGKSKEELAVVHAHMVQHLEAVKKLVEKLQHEYGRPAWDDKPFQSCPADYLYLYDQEHTDRKAFAHHVNVAWFDTEALLEWIRTNAEALENLGITNLVKGCYDEGAHTVCPTPDTYFYWDSFHVTTKIHHAIAYAIERYL